MRIFQRQQERQRDQGADTFDLLQQRYLRVAPAGQHLDALVVLANLLAQHFDSRQQRLQCHLQLWTQAVRFFWIHIAYVAPAQPLAVALGQSAGCVDQRRSCTYQPGSCPDHRQIRLRFCTTVFHRT